MTASVFEQYIVDEVDTWLALYGETVTYYPTVGVGREIQAIVNRKQVGGLDGLPHGNAPMAEIFAANDATKGIGSDEINTGGDKIGYAYRIGNTPLQCRIAKMQTIDYAWLKLEVRG